jgi:sugar (pentulose or hexulose) kinase
MDTILVLDVGTSSMRGILFSMEGEMLKTEQRKNPPVYLSADLVEMDPVRYGECLYGITGELVRFAREQSCTIRAVSLTALRSCTLFCRENGNVLHNTIMWHDKRAQDICRLLSGQEEEIFSRTGAILSPVFSGTKYAWMRRHHPALYRETQRLVVVPDYLLFLMCETWATDHTYGSRTALMNLHTLEWDPWLLQLFGVEKEKLPPLIPPGTIAGKTTRDFYEKTGLPVGTPVISAGGDQQCGVLGAGACRAGDCHITVGSGAYVSVVTEKPVIDPRRRFVCGAAAVKGQSVLEASVLSSAVLYNWFFQRFYSSQEQAAGMKETIDREAQQAPIGSGGVLFLPYFQGRGSPDWNPEAPGGFLHLSLETQRGHMARAILEGIALEIGENYQILRQFAPSPSNITAGGGLTKSPLFVQMLADVLGTPLQLCQTGETTAVGAFLSASVALGSYKTPGESAQKLLHPGREIRPDMDRHAFYQTLLEKRKHYCEALK